MTIHFCLKQSLLVIFILCYNFGCYSQSWQWAKVHDSGSEGYSICNDLNGNVYLAGVVGGTVANTEFTITTPGNNAILMKHDPNGNLIWVRTINPAIAYGVADDYAGNTILTGKFTGTAVIGNDTLISAGGFDVFLVKFDPNGNVLWARRSGSSNPNEVGNSVTTDPQGNVIVTGTFEGPSFVAGTNTLISNSTRQYFIIKYDLNGNALWASCGASGNIASNSVSTDNNGNVFIGGQYSLTAVIGTNTLTSLGFDDYFVAKYNSTGNAIWAASGGGTGGEAATCISVDPSNNIYLTGAYQYTITIGTFTFSTLGSTDIFVSKYNNNGGLIWAKSFGGTYNDIGYGLASFSGGVYVSGHLGQTGMVVGTNTLNTTASSDGLFLIQLDSFGNPIYSTSLNGGGDDVMDLSLDNNCNLFLGGDIFTTPLVVGTYTLTHSAQEAFFLAKFNSGFSSPTLSISGNFSVCAGNSTTLTATGATNYTWSTAALTNSIVVSPTVTSNYLVIGMTPTLGCSSKMIQTVMVYPSPTINAVANKTIVCSGNSVTLTVSGASSYSWSNGAQTQSTTISPVITSTYVVTGTSGFGCNYSVVQVVSVNPLPTLTLNATNTTICLGNATTLKASGANTYSWSSGQQIPSIVLTPSVQTTYTVVGTNTITGCSETSSIQINVSGCVDINEKSSFNEEVRIYPNPNNGCFLIETSVFSTGLNLSIRDVFGKAVFTKELSQPQTMIETQLTPGIYICELDQGINKVGTVKVIVQ